MLSAGRTRSSSRATTSRWLVTAILVGASAWAIGPARADTPLTLADAIKGALAGNRDLERERLAIESAAAGLLAAGGAFDVQLAGNLNFSRSTTPPISGTDVSAGRSERVTTDWRLARALETGGTIGLGVAANTTLTNSGFACGDFTGSNVSCRIWGASMSLDFRHPLLRGFGREIAEANLRRQRLQQDLAALNRLTRASTVLRDVIEAYWELAYATEELAINRSAVELAREQLRFTEAQIQVGRAAPLEAAAAQRAIAEREQTVAVSEQGLYLRTMDLRRLLGLTTEPGTPTFAASETPTAAPREVDARREIQAALDMNPQLRSLRNGLTLNEIDAEVAENLLRPQLDATGSFGTTGRNIDLDETLQQASRLEEVTWSAGLQFSMPLGNRAARGQRDATGVAQRLARLGADEFEMTLRDSVLRTAMAIRTASRRLELARQAVGYAEQDLQAERARFDVGRSTNNEILRRQQDLRAAQIGVVRATVDLIRGETNLAALTGALLERHGLRLK